MCTYCAVHNDIYESCRISSRLVRAEQLEAKAKELYKRYMTLEEEKYDLEVKVQLQDFEVRVVSPHCVPHSTLLLSTPHTFLNRCSYKFGGRVRVITIIFREERERCREERKRCEQIQRE